MRLMRRRLTRMRGRSDETSSIFAGERVKSPRPSGGSQGLRTRRIASDVPRRRSAAITVGFARLAIIGLRAPRLKPRLSTLRRCVGSMSCPSSMTGQHVVAEHPDAFTSADKTLVALHTIASVRDAPPSHPSRSRTTLSLLRLRGMR